MLTYTHARNLHGFLWSFRWWEMREEEEKREKEEEQKRRRRCKFSPPAYNPNMYIFLMWSRR